MAETKDDGIVGISRKLWIALANDQLAKRKRIFGSQANVCEGCLEILMCEGPISFQVCERVEELMAAGLVTGPKKIKYSQLRRRILPVSIDCLEAYGLVKKKEAS